MKMTVLQFIIDFISGFSLVSFVMSIYSGQVFKSFDSLRKCLLKATLEPIFILLMALIITCWFSLLWKLILLIQKDFMFLFNQVF